MVMVRQDKQANDETKLLNELVQHFNESEKYIQPLRDNADFSWDDRENMLVGVLTDIGSKQTKSKVNTGDLVNLVFDGAARVMAQFPTGTIQALDTDDDKAKNLLMNVVHEKYIIPNADSQYDLLTKLRVWDIYSRVFGSMPALVDYRIDDDYIGPDLWLIHPRAFFPQAGTINVNSMDYCQVSTWVSMEFLKSQDKKVWKNIAKLIKKVKGGAKTKAQQDQKYQPVNERTPNSQIQPEEGDFASCELHTEYRKDRWITYSKEFSLIVRDIPNPQKNNELPIVMKHCFPLLDRLYGLAEFERGSTLQKAADSLVSLYFDGVQMSIFPPLIIDQNGVVASTIEYKAKAKWIRTKENAIQQLQLSPQGLNTFNSTYSFLKSQILNLGATTDTSVTKEQDPGMGKTPQALKNQNAREGARDAWDRFMMEQAVECVNQKFIDLLTTKQEKPIDITLFKSDIRKLQEAYPNEDVTQVFGIKNYTSGNGKIQVPSSSWKSGKNTIKFKYTIDSGSTMKKEDDEEHQALVEIMGLILKFPDALPQISQKGTFTMGDKVFNFGEAIKRYIITSGVQDSEKIISDNKDNPQSQDQGQQIQGQVQQMGQQMQQMMQVIQELQKQVEQTKQRAVKSPSESINYKDATPFIKAQIEAQAGMTPDPVHAHENVQKLADTHAAIHQAVSPVAQPNPVGK